MPDMKTKTKLNERLTIWQMADLFVANISANKISLPQSKRNQPFTLFTILAFSFVLIPISSDVRLWHLYIRDPTRKNKWVLFKC